jgi:DsbC/DsbD-like thiol-disulfide interchange protein
MEPLVGFEPTTYSLRMNCSTPELQRHDWKCEGETSKCAVARQAEFFDFVDGNEVLKKRDWQPGFRCGALAPMPFLLQSLAMIRSILLLACLLPVSNAGAQGKGHASASWIAEKGDIAAGSPIRTVIRMTVDEGWHTYWKNPGEVGIPISLKADLPEGWKLGEIEYPVPHRITTEGLTSFCLEGEVLLPLTLTPPSGFAGKLPALRGTLSWLACNDEGCIPGDAEIALSDVADPETASKAYAALPQPIPGAKLQLTLADDDIILTLILPADSEIDPSAFEVFPATRNVISPAAQPAFAKNPAAPGTWIAKAAKSEYLDGKPEGLALVLANKSGAAWTLSTARQ